ncbi:hypothetical protein [Streptomyces sp. SudanB52_2052]|uniref:hypothetical protein n=1 Tax=Streptomyces sp. SudanB52_2052 TaxID=3035276 RepID=UPI0026CBB91B
MDDISHGGVDDDASLSAPPGRTRGFVFLGLAVLGVAGAVFAMRRPLMMSAPACAAGRWHGCFDTFNGVVLMTLAALPLAWLVVWALARRRRAADVTAAWRTSLAEVGMVTMGSLGIVGNLLVLAAPAYDSGHHILAWPHRACRYCEASRL